jgi:hypothetical protein
LPTKNIRVNLCLLVHVNFEMRQQNSAGACQKIPLLLGEGGLGQLWVVGVWDLWERGNTSV